MSATVANDVVAHVKNFDCGYRLIALHACCECRVRDHLLRADEGTARVVTIEQKSERIVLPAVIALPNSMAGTALRRARAGPDPPLRHRSPEVECGESDDRGRPNRLASLTVDNRYNCSPSANDRSIGIPRRSETTSRG